MCRVPPARAELSAATASVAPWVSGDSVRGASPPSATTRLRTPSGSWSSRLVVPLMPFWSSPAPAAEVSSTVAVASCGPSTGLASVGSVPESPLATSNVPGWASDGGGSTPTIIVIWASPGTTATTSSVVAAPTGPDHTSAPATTASAAAASQLSRRGEDDDIVEVVVGSVVELAAAGDQPQRRLQVRA